MRFGPVRGRYQLLCRHRTPKRRSKLPKARFPLVMKTRERDGNDDERGGVDAHGERRLRRGPKMQSTFLSYSVFLMYEWARHHGDFVPHSRAQYMPEGMSLGHVRFAPGEGAAAKTNKRPLSALDIKHPPPPRPPADSPVRTDAGSMQNPGGHWEFGSRAMGGTKKEDQYVKHRAVRVSSLRRRFLHAHASR